MNLQQFLEEETQNITQYAYFVEHQSEEELAEVIREHNLRIINKVLDEVVREVGKLYEPYEGEEHIMIEHAMLDEVSKLLDQLKLK